MSYPPFRSIGDYVCVFGNIPFSGDYNPIAGYAPVGFYQWPNARGTYVSPTQLTCLSPSWQYPLRGPGPPQPINGPVDVVIIDQNSNGLPLVELVPGLFVRLNVAFYQPAAWSWLQPQILSIDPPTGGGWGDDPFTVTGDNFYPGYFTVGGGENNPNYIRFGSQEVPVDYVNATTLVGRTPGAWRCTPQNVDVTLLPPRLPSWTNVGQPTIAQPSSSLPGAFTYGSSWWVYDVLDDPYIASHLEPWSFETCSLRIDSDWNLFLDWFRDHFGFEWGAEFPPGHWTFQFVKRVPPFDWKYFGPYIPGPRWKFDGSAPDPNGWWTSVSGYRGDIFVVANARPADPRTWTDFAGWATGTAWMLGGSPGIAATFRNRIVYAASGYGVGTEGPPLRIYDGSYDRELVRIPPTAAGEAHAIVSLLTADGTIFVATWDAGIDSATWTGRVFMLDIEAASLMPLGAPFPAGHLPYALAWHNGMLWCGTHRHDPALPGKVYRLRPELQEEAVWTEDYAVPVGGVAALQSFHGTLFVGTTAAAGTYGAILARATDGTYATVDLGGGGASGSTARPNNGYLAFGVFRDTLYASFWDGSAPTPPTVSLIRQSSDGVAWTTSLTAGLATANRPFIVLGVDDGTLFAIGGGGDVPVPVVIVATEDGTAWEDRTPQLPDGAVETALPAFGVVVL